VPIITTLDKVRLLVGDTDPDAPLLNDDELDYFIDARADDEHLAAADVAEALAARFARKPDFSADGQSVSRKQFDYYLKLAGELRQRSSAGGLKAVEVERLDGYSEGISARDGAGQTGSRGRVLRGYTDPDMPA